MKRVQTNLLQGLLLAGLLVSVATASAQLRPEVVERIKPIGTVALPPAPEPPPAAVEPTPPPPVVEESVAVEPVVEEPAAVEPVVEESTAAEPVVEEPAVVEPVVEESTAAEPIVEEPAATEPVVEEMVAAAAPSAPQIDAEAIYNRSCIACHLTGAANAPILGNREAWADRLAKGMDALYTSSINGMTGTAMPPRGTCGACSDEELKAVTDFMVSKVQ